MRTTKILQILLVVMFCISTACRRQEVPIYQAVGLTPISDITSDRGIHAHRELIYKNVDNDPNFYHKIIKRVETCSSIKDNLCRKEAGADMPGDSLTANGFSVDDIKESVTFRSPDSKFACIISNGGTFVLIIIYTT